MVRKSKLSHHIIKNNALGYKNTELYVTTNIGTPYQTKHS